MNSLSLLLYLELTNPPREPQHFLRHQTHTLILSDCHHNKQRFSGSGESPARSHSGSL